MDAPALPVSVLGAGAWGTALAIHAARRHPVRLWARDAAQAAAIQAARRNERYLPDVELPASLDVTADFGAALRFAEGGLLVIATPMAGLRATLAALGGDTPVLWLCKGFEAGTGALGHEIAAEVAGGRAAGVLSGPSFALEVAQGLPTALVAASFHAAVRERALQVFHAGSLRVYASTDPVGVEVGGAVKNVLAIATGICDGMGLGMNARAALVTRGLAEMARLGAALGARPETFMGLSGLGDLVLTATGSLSRNRKVGLKLAEGLPLARILADLGHVAEGVACAPVVRTRAASLGVEMPLAFAVDDVLRGELTPVQALERLLGREARAES
jgi:glycerol-3-phosphate dehydrogenase (NAD(P)+)